MKNAFSFKLPRQWTVFPMVYKGDQIVAEISHWTNRTRIWLNDEIIDQKKGSRFNTVDNEKVCRVHEFNLPSGERVSLSVGISLSDGMFLCTATVDGKAFYEKSFSETKPEEPPTFKDTLLTLIPAGIAGGVMGYFVTHYILGTL